MTAAVIVALRVGVTPDVAFTAFTRDIGLWWKSHPLFQLSRRGDGALRFDPTGPDGRLVTRFDDGKEWEIGAVHHWLPGERLAFGWRLPSFKADQATEVDVRFEAVGDETRVTVEHRAETCRAARFRADAVPAKVRRVLAGVAQGDGSGALAPLPLCGRG